MNVDESTIRARSAFPACRACGAIARPNILMFNDWDWDSSSAEAQMARYANWLQLVEGRRVVAIELGAGLAIPTVRHECEEHGQPLVRINPREAETPAGGISLPMSALDALQALDSRMPG